MTIQSVGKIYSSQENILGSSGAYTQIGGESSFGAGGATSGTTGWTKSIVMETISSGYQGNYIVADTCFGQVSAADLVVGVFGGISSGSMDDQPMFSMAITKLSDSGYAQISFPMYDLARFQLGFATVSSSDVLTKVWSYHRSWKFQSSS